MPTISASEAVEMAKHVALTHRLVVKVKRYETHSEFTLVRPGAGRIGTRRDPRDFLRFVKACCRGI